MTTVVKLDSFLLQPIHEKLAAHADALYNWGSVMIVGELTGTERTEPRPDEEDRVKAIKARLTAVEIPSRAYEDHIRRVQEALYRIRTREGTFDEVLAGGDAQLLEHAGAVLLDKAGDRAP